MREHFLIGRRLFRRPLHFSLELVERNKFVDLRCSAAATHFQIAQNDCAFSILLEKNERIARPKLGRVKHVRVDVAWSNDEA